MRSVLPSRQSPTAVSTPRQVKTSARSRDRQRRAIGTAWRFIVPLSTLLVASCAWVDTHPHSRVLATSLTENAGLQANSDPLPAMKRAMTIAEAQRDLYNARAREQSIIRGSLGIGLAAASATALFLGITSDSPDVVTVTGIGGATALGLNSYFDSRPRQGLYFKGAQSIQCWISAVRPYDVKQTDLTTFAGQIEALRQASSSVEAAIVNANAALATLAEGAPLRVVGTAQVDFAEVLRRRANTLANTSTSTLGAIDESANALEKGVRDIVTAIDLEVMKTEPDLGVLVGSFADLGTVAGLVAQTQPIGGMAAAPEATTPSGEQLYGPGDNAVIAALEVLESTTQTLSDASIPVAAFTSRIAARTEKAVSSEECQPPEAEIAAAIVPAGPVIDVQAPDEVTFRVTGDARLADLSFALGQKLVDGTIKKDVDPDSLTRIFVVTIGENAKTADATLTFEPNLPGLASSTITLRVKKAETETIDRGSQSDTERNPDVEKVQILVGLRQVDDTAVPDRVDGVLGDITKDAVTKYLDDFVADEGVRQTLKDAGPTGPLFIAHVDQALRDPVLDPDDTARIGAIAGEQSVFEKTRMPAGSTDLQAVVTKLQALGHGDSLSSAYDRATRSAIAKFQAAQKRRVTGLLGQVLVDAITEAPAE